MKIIKKSYNIIRTLLPTDLNGIITKALYSLNIKPTVNNKRVSDFSKKGIIVISADFEMAWAFRYSKTQSHNASKLGLQERENVPILIKLFEKYNIPITWATVGHLFLDKCERTNHKAHPEMIRPDHFENKNWWFDEGDWYDDDPCTDYKADPAWYAPDLIEQIINSPIKHEIGCHTFSHIDFSYANCSKELAQAEIQKCKIFAEEKGINIKSMVFPGGTYGNYEVLKNEGIKCYRKRMDYDIDVPYIDKYGLVAIPSSFGMDKPTYKCSSKTCLNMAKAYAKRTIKYKKVAHLWFHSSMNEWYLKYVFPQVLDFIRKMENEGKIEILTMEQLTARVLQNY